jgi:hypothetical protein
MQYNIIRYIAIEVLFSPSGASAVVPPVEGSVVGFACSAASASAVMDPGGVAYTSGMEWPLPKLSPLILSEHYIFQNYVH